MPAGCILPVWIFSPRVLAVRAISAKLSSARAAMISLLAKAVVSPRTARKPIPPSREKEPVFYFAFVQTPRFGSCALHKNIRPIQSAQMVVYALLHLTNAQIGRRQQSFFGSVNSNIHRAIIAYFLCCHSLFPRHSRPAGAGILPTPRKRCKRRRMRRLYCKAPAGNGRRRILLAAPR